MRAGLDGKGNGKMGLPHPRGTEKNDVFVFGKEGQVKKFQHGFFIQLGMKREIHSSQPEPEDLVRSQIGHTPTGFFALLSCGHKP